MTHRSRYNSKGVIFGVQLNTLLGENSKNPDLLGRSGCLKGCSKGCSAARELGVQGRRSTRAAR